MDNVTGASDAPAAGWCLATIKVFHTSAAFLTHARRDESKVFLFSHELKHLKVFKSVQLQIMHSVEKGRGGAETLFFLLFVG